VASGATTTTISNLANVGREREKRRKECGILLGIDDVYGKR
jgi:hypothetical protein